MPNISMDTSNKSKFVTSWYLATFLHFIFLHEPTISMSIDKATISMSIDKVILDAAPKAEMFDFLHIMPSGEAMIVTELDLLLTMDQYKLLYTDPSTSREKRKAVREIKTRWKDRIVYYEITESLSSARDIIEQAIKEWEKYTCLEFVEDASAPKRIQFMNGGGCYSQLGMQNKPQPIALAPLCRTKGIITHEIGHAIGWYHEHMRPDRDDFITVNFDVIPTNYHRNFLKYNSSVVDTHGIPYDYNSIMHYGNQAVRGAITTIDPIYQDSIGQRQGFTFKDIKLANIMYKCAEANGCKPQECAHNGFVLCKNYNNTGSCLCWCDSGNVNEPLVLCSSIVNEASTPSPVSTVVPSTTTTVQIRPTTKECYDVRKDCEELLYDNIDICMHNMKTMMASCAKTCNFCGKGEGICMDHEKGCPVLAAAEACNNEGLRATMLMLCPASCGICKPSDPCSIQFEMLGSTAGRSDISKLISTLLCIYVLAIFNRIL